MREVHHLITGKKYHVIRPFTDYDHILHPVGETWTFVKNSFLPYEDGLTLHVLNDNSTEEVIYRFKWRQDQQTAIIENFTHFVEIYNE